MPSHPARRTCPPPAVWRGPRPAPATIEAGAVRSPSWRKSRSRPAIPAGWRTTATPSRNGTSRRPRHHQRAATAVIPSTTSPNSASPAASSSRRPTKLALPCSRVSTTPPVSSHPTLSSTPSALRQPGTGQPRVHTAAVGAAATGPYHPALWPRESRGWLEGDIPLLPDRRWQAHCWTVEPGWFKRNPPRAPAQRHLPVAGVTFLVPIASQDSRAVDGISGFPRELSAPPVSPKSEVDDFARSARSLLDRPW